MASESRRDTHSLRAWIALARAPGLSADLLGRALDALGGATEVAAASAAALGRHGLAPKTCEYLASVRGASWAAELRWLEDPRHQLLPFTDPRFPSLLAQIPDRPVALYVVGDPAVLQDPQIAVVGSRNPSPQGRDTSREFAQFLAQRGLGITSGLAEGIDSAAHRGALRAGGPTVAVLGTGPDIVYPRGNSGLSDDIANHGALITEFPPGAPPRREHFPRRNRLIAALTLGCLVVEAAQRSGSLITARLANELGRDVFAVPGSIHNPLARGCHELIRAGAILVQGPGDILKELNFSSVFQRPHALPWAHAAGAGGVAGMDKDRKILLDALGFDPADVDVLVVRTGLKPAAVSSMMLILELEGHVQTAPGGRYSRVANRRAGGER